MMGFGAPVRGASSLSSNLSASAPPFTVESSGSKPKSNPLVSVNESPYISAPPLFHNPNTFSNHDLKVEPYAAPYLNQANNDQYLGSFSLYSSNPQFHSSNMGSVSPNTDAFGFPYLFDKAHDTVKSLPYRSHYVGHVVNDEAPLVSLTETNADFLSNRERSMGSSLHDVFAGHSFGLEYTTPQGCDFWNGEGNVEQALKMHDDVSGHERSTGLAASSYLHKDYRLGDYPITSKLDVSHKKDVGLTSRERQVQFLGMEANSNNKIGTPSDQSYRPFFGDSSGMSSTFDRSRITMPKTGLVADGYNNAFVSPNLTYEKEQQLTQDSTSLNGYITNMHSFARKKDDQAFDTSSFARSEDLSSNLVDNDYMQHKIPCIDVPKAYNSVLGNLTVVTEIPSDCYVSAVDSPCWKGASASRISSSEECEASNSNNLKKKGEGSNFLDFQGKGTENLSCEDNGGNLIEHAEQIFDEIEKLGKYFPEMDRKENQPTGDLTNEQNLKELPSESCDFIISNNRFYLDSVIDHGLDNIISDHTSCLPANEVAEKTEKMHSTKSLPRMNTQVLVDSMCNLSEVLMFQASTDPTMATTLSEKDCENIRHMISNLDELLKISGRVLDRDQESVPPVEECTQDHLKDTNTGRFGNLASCEVNLFSGKDDDKILPREGDLNSVNDDLICGLKDVLIKNFNTEEELHPQTVLYKNLWLEAESAICATNVKARFNRMKLEMGKFKSNSIEVAENSKIAAEEETAATDEDVRAKIWPESSSNNNTHTLDKSMNDSPIPCKNDVEASVMARFLILKGRGDANISNLENNVEEEDVKKQLSYEDGHETVKKFGEYKYSDLTRKEMIGQKQQTLLVNRIVTQMGKSGKSDDNSSSSDWEHVLKDEIV